MSENRGGPRVPRGAPSVGGHGGPFRGPPSGIPLQIATRWADLREAFARFVYGLTGYEFARHAVEMRHQLEAVFMVVTFGDLVGVPILPPIYSLRLLPHVVPEVATWKRHLARRKEFWEKEEYDLHGI